LKRINDLSHNIKVLFVQEISNFQNFLMKSLNHTVNDPTIIFCTLFLLFFLGALWILDKMNFQIVMDCIIDWFDKECAKKGKLLCIIFIISLLFLVCGGLYSILSMIIISDQNSYANSLNSYFDVKYQNEIKPQSEIEINHIVNETINISNFSERLDRIAEWETQNFTDVYWHHVSSKRIIPYADIYTYNSEGKIRVAQSSIATSPYAGDPDWITYYRFGACGEESALFANVSNRTGIVSRPIILDLGHWEYGIVPVQTGNHAFLEVQLNDDEWYFYDPTVYGADHVLNESPCKNSAPCQNRWFGKPEQYSYFASWQVLRIYRGDTGEDVSDRYTRLSESIVNAKRVFSSKYGLSFVNRHMTLPINVNETFVKFSISHH